MNELSRILDLRMAVHRELFKYILPYWSNKVYNVESDDFHGRIDADNVIHPEADRSAVLYSRIAYTYAASFSFSKDASLLPKLQAALNVLNNHFIDANEGGLFWMINPDGNPVDRRRAHV